MSNEPYLGFDMGSGDSCSLALLITHESGVRTIELMPVGMDESVLKVEEAMRLNSFNENFEKLLTVIYSRTDKEVNSHG